MFGKKGGGGSFCHRQGSVTCRATCIRADNVCGRSSVHASLYVATCGPMWGEPLPGNAGGKVGLQERGVSGYSRQFLGSGVCGVCIVHPFLQQVAVRVCAMYGCERDGVCAKPGVCGLRSVYVSAEGSSGVCTPGRRVKPSCEASSVRIGHRRETRR